MSTNNNVTGVKISEFNVSQSITDGALLPFVQSGANLTITYGNFKNALGVTGQIKPLGSALSVSVLNQPASGLNYIRGVAGSQGVTTTLAPTGEINIRTNLANDVTGEGVIVDPTAQQVKFKSLVGGLNTSVSTVDDTLVIDVEDADPLSKQKIVRSVDDFDNPLLSDVQYFIDSQINMGSTQLNVGSGGANIAGLGYGLSSLSSAAVGYTMFNGAAAGGVRVDGVDISVTGSGSQVFGLTNATGNSSVEMSNLSFNNCTSLGTLNGYRQGLETNTFRNGGSPTLTLNGAMSGYRITTSLVRGVLDGTDIFSAGGSLTMSGRFITDINCDLAATGALFDFVPSNFTNNESLIVVGAFVTRQGVVDASDTTIYPNIDHTSVKSNWTGNTGMPNTRKYIKSKNTVDTNIDLSTAGVNTYLPLSGTYTTAIDVQFDTPVSGQYRLLTGNGAYNITGSIQVSGANGDLIELRATLSSDNGATFPTEIESIVHEIPNFIGSNDFATFALSFLAEIKENERVRLEVRNLTAARDVENLAESFIVITEV